MHTGRRRRRGRREDLAMGTMSPILFGIGWRCEARANRISSPLWPGIRFAPVPQCMGELGAYCMTYIAQEPHLTYLASGRVSGGIIPSCTALGLSAMGWPAVCGSMRSYGAGSDHECLHKCMHDCFYSVVSVSFANHSHIMATNT